MASPAAHQPRPAASCEGGLTPELTGYVRGCIAGPVFFMDYFRTLQLEEALSRCTVSMKRMVPVL